jgi:hypothetical protein
MIDPKIASKNINYLNKIKKQLSRFLTGYDSLEKINLLENIIFRKDISKKIVESELNIKLTNKEYVSIFDIEYSDIYPTKKQSKEFVSEIKLLVLLDDLESNKLENKFIHVWQIPRSTDIPSFNSLLNLISLFAESEVDNSLLLKMKSILINESKVA